MFIVGYILINVCMFINLPEMKGLQNEVWPRWADAIYNALS